MKKNILLLTLLFATLIAYAQENNIILSGGYAFAKIEDTEVKATGWRINAVYEFRPQGGNFAHGLSIGYVSMSGENTEAPTANYEIGSWPIYYAPRFLFGNEKINGFIKGALGWQFSNLNRSGNIGSLEANDSGFAGGGGAGFAYIVNEKIFLNAEYELLWMSNAYYKDGWLNTASLGIGFRF